MEIRIELQGYTLPSKKKKKSTVVVFSKNNFSFLDLINKYFLSIYYIHNTMLNVWVKESYKGKQYTELESHVGLLQRVIIQLLTVSNVSPDYKIS